VREVAVLEGAKSQLELNAQRHTKTKELSVVKEQEDVKLQKELTRETKVREVAVLEGAKSQLELNAQRHTETKELSAVKEQEDVKLKAVTEETTVGAVTVLEGIKKLVDLNAQRHTDIKAISVVKEQGNVTLQGDMAEVTEKREEKVQKSVKSQVDLDAQHHTDVKELSVVKEQDNVTKQTEIREEKAQKSVASKQEVDVSKLQTGATEETKVGEVTVLGVKSQLDQEAQHHTDVKEISVVKQQANVTLQRDVTKETEIREVVQKSVTSKQEVDVSKLQTGVTKETKVREVAVLEGVKSQLDQEVQHHTDVKELSIVKQQANVTLQRDVTEETEIQEKVQKSVTSKQVDVELKGASVVKEQDVTKLQTGLTKDTKVGEVTVLGVKSQLDQEVQQHTDVKKISVVKQQANVTLQRHVTEETGIQEEVQKSVTSKQEVEVAKLQTGVTEETKVGEVAVQDVKSQLHEEVQHHTDVKEISAVKEKTDIKLQKDITGETEVREVKEVKVQDDVEQDFDVKRHTNLTEVSVVKVQGDVKLQKDVTGETDVQEKTVHKSVTSKQDLDVKRHTDVAQTSVVGKQDKVKLQTELTEETKVREVTVQGVKSQVDLDAQRHTDIKEVSVVKDVTLQRDVTEETEKREEKVEKSITSQQELDIQRHIDVKELSVVKEQDVAKLQRDVTEETKLHEVTVQGVKNQQDLEIQRHTNIKESSVVKEQTDVKLQKDITGETEVREVKEAVRIQNGDKSQLDQDVQRRVAVKEQDNVRLQKDVTEETKLHEVTVQGVKNQQDLEIQRHTNIKESSVVKEQDDVKLQQGVTREILVREVSVQKDVQKQDLDIQRRTDGSETWVIKEQDHAGLQTGVTEQTSVRDGSIIHTVLKERLTITDTFGSDVITACTQGSVNNQLLLVWKAARSRNSCLKCWTYEGISSAFGPIQLEFPRDSSSKTLTLYITLKKGPHKLRPNQEDIESDDYPFSDRKLAFEVTLKEVDYSGHLSTTRLRLEEWKVAERHIKHLGLDFSNFKCLSDLSSLSSLDNNDRVESKHHTMQTYFEQYFKHYFKQLVNEGHHIICSFPIITQLASQSVLFAPSSFSFQFFTLSSGTTAGYHSHGHGDRTMLVIYGIPDKVLRATPPSPYTWNGSYIEQAALFGTFFLSHSIFLEGWLLPKLRRVNWLTAMPPVHFRLDKGGEWIAQSIPWLEGEFEGDSEYDWIRKEQSEKGLGYEWMVSDELIRKHTVNTRSKRYSIVVTTANNVILVSQNGVCAIKLFGEVDLSLTHSQRGSSSAKALWTSVISFTSEKQGGFRVEKLKLPWEFKDTSPQDSNGEGKVSALTLLKNEFEAVELVEDGTINEMNNLFTGTWPLFFSGSHGYTLSNPAFNSNGDLHFDLLCSIDDGEDDDVPNSQVYQADKSDLNTSMTIVPAKEEASALTSSVGGDISLQTSSHVKESVTTSSETFATIPSKEVHNSFSLSQTDHQLQQSRKTEEGRIPFPDEKEQAKGEGQEGYVKDSGSDVQDGEKSFAAMPKLERKASSSRSTKRSYSRLTNLLSKW